MKTNITSVDAYINGFPKPVQKLLKQVRSTIKSKAPNAEESISYGMPAYQLNGRPLVYFAGYEKHVGFYATPNGHEAFAKELSKYKQGKGSVQFPIDQPMPLALIASIVEFRVADNNERFAPKAKTSFLDELAAPARRSLQNNGIKSLKDLAKRTEKEILEFHGMGKTTIPKLKELLKDEGLVFKK